MNGAHDLGGRHGFGAVNAESDEPVFHARWEARFFGLVNGLGKYCTWTLDEDRHTCENQNPQAYYAQSYYANWLQAFEKLLVRHDVVAMGNVSEPGLENADVVAALSDKQSYERSIDQPASFKIGDVVRLKNLQPQGHTRLPGYLRGHIGQVIAVRGAHVFPDRNAHGHGEDPQWLYSLRFDAAEIWGKPSKDVIFADLWEPYLEHA